MVWKRKRGNEGGRRLHFSKIFLSTHREVLWTQWQWVEEHFKWIQWLLSCQAFKKLNIWKSQDGCNILLVTTYIVCRQTSMLRWSMARKFNKCLTERIVSYIAVEGLACDLHISYDGQRWATIWHGYPNDDKTSHPTAQYNKGRFTTTAGQPKV